MTVPVEKTIYSSYTPLDESRQVNRLLGKSPVQKPAKKLFPFPITNTMLDFRSVFQYWYCYISVVNGTRFDL
jgi:hypothetical protein